MSSQIEPGDMVAFGIQQNAARYQILRVEDARVYIKEIGLKGNRVLYTPHYRAIEDIKQHWDKLSFHLL